MVGVSLLLLIPGLIILFYIFVFKRDPKLTIPDGDNIISPCDGKVVGIYSSQDKAVIPKGMLGLINTLTKDVAEKTTIISIMMTPLNVHFQYAPIQGIVKNINYFKGKFQNAVNEQSLKIFENENNQILIEGSYQNKPIKIKVIQIAGILARRIKCFVKKEEKINKGQKIGFIDLGSQVTLIIPDTISLKIKVGDKVKPCQALT
tara:strand:- start:348 stop:959 length:612 start_codon:yes stop_codon:yes gene_type:complete